MELFLARHFARIAELAANIVVPFEHRHCVAALCRGNGTGEAGGPRAHDGDAPRLDGRLDAQLRFISGARVHQAGSTLLAEDFVEAGLIAGNAGIDLVAAPFCGLVEPVRIGEQRARHRHQIGEAFAEQTLGD